MVETASATADDLTTCLKKTFENGNVSLDNFVGFSSDTTNVMFGSNLSVVSNSRKEYPHVAFIKCSCHLIHLVASKACLKLPRSVEDKLRNIGSHFSRSYYRHKHFKEFQEFFHVEIHKIISPSRWLRLQECVNRILEQYLPLQMNFIQNVFQDPSKTTDVILITMNNKFTLAYLEFMSYVLYLLHDFNTIFQQEQPLLHTLQRETIKLLKTLASNYMKLSVLKAAKTRSLLIAKSKILMLCNSFNFSIQIDTWVKK